jgi:putative photosynthetic complex assembly protein
MSDHSNPLMPRKVLVAFASLILFSVVLVGAARLTGYGMSQVPQEPIVKSVDLRFEDRADGALVVRDAKDGSVVKVIEPGSDQFIRGILRAQVRMRHSYGVAVDQPYQVARLADGRLSVRDLATGRVIELRSFGPTNEGAYAALLDARDGAPAQAPVTAAQTVPPR